MKGFLIFPNQLFSDHGLLANHHEIILAEEHLFFKEFPFHKLKLCYHRTCMRHYEQMLRRKGI